MPQLIPERQPVEDPFRGAIIRVGTVDGLATQPQPDSTLIADGAFTVRYGLRFLGKPHRCIVPGLVVLDYGEMLTGEAAWDFLQKRSNLHPRAEVAGFRDDGTDDLVFVRQLDLALLPQVLVYDAPTATRPLARPALLVAPTNAELPPRLSEYLPRFDSLTDWKKGTP